MIFGITTLLQMESETPSGDACTQYAVPRALAGPSGDRIMERRPNSWPDTPCPPPPTRRFLPGELPPACLERGRARTYRIMTCWDGPRYPAFNSYDSGLCYFARRSWPHPKRSPVFFAAAGLFYTGKDLCLSLLDQTHNCSIPVPSTLLFLSSRFRTRRLDTVFPLR